MTQLNWKRSIGQIVMANKGCRLLGLTAVRHGAGVSTICRRAATLMATGGAKTLVVCLSEPHASATRHGSEKPTSALRSAIVPSLHGYDLLNCPDSDGLLATLNAVQLRDILDNEFSDYDRIIIDLPPLCDDTSDGLSTAGIATVCDRVLLVCVVGVDHRAELAEAAAILHSSGATLAGVVSNEYKRVDFMDYLRKSRFAQAAQ